MTRSAPHQRFTSAAEIPREFMDERGQRWKATLVPSGGGAVEFSCVSDARRPVRAIAMDTSVRLQDVSDDTLCAWLRDAPRIGRLT